MDVKEYLSKFYKGTKAPTLDVMRYFMEKLSHPEKKLKIIHIAGTNGKGSITEMLSTILEKQGYKTGKFMSPHILRYNERICINHKEITDQEMEELMIYLSPFVDQYNHEHETKVTFFELETTMALVYFARNNCDFVVLETGLGGLYDCTNIVNPIISAISTIGFDHMDLLGNTLEEIAIQKAGIIKENSSSVFIMQEPEVTKIMIETAKQKNNELHLIKKEDMKNIGYQGEMQKFDYQDQKDIRINLKGKRQIGNASIVLECVKILREKGYMIQEENVRTALQTVIHKARFEKINTNPTIIFDGGHNESAIQNLKETIKDFYPNQKKVYIFSILKTKDYKTVIKELMEDKESTYIFTDGTKEVDEVKQYVPKEDLLKEAKKYGNKNLKVSSLQEAMKACHIEYKNEIIFIIGSFYTYQEVMKELKEENK